MDDLEGFTLFVTLLLGIVPLTCTIVARRTAAVLVPGVVWACLGVVMLVAGGGDTHGHDAAGAFGDLGSGMVRLLGYHALVVAVLCMVLGAVLHRRHRPLAPLPPAHIHRD